MNEHADTLAGTPPHHRPPASHGRPARGRTPEEQLAFGLDRALLDWQRHYPDDGFVFGVLLHVRGRCPAREALAAHLRRKLPQVPVLTEHLTGPERRERWHTARDADAGAHLHALHLPKRPESLARTCALLSGHPVPTDAPHWALSQLAFPDGEEHLLAYRVHHAAQDGTALTHTLERLFDADPAAAALPAPHATGTLVPPPSAGAGTADGSQVQDHLPACVTVPLATLRSIARTTGGTVNTVYLAALAGALRAWPALPEHPGTVGVDVPFSTRQPHDRPDRGNRTSALRVALPVGEADPLRRLAGIDAQLRGWKARDTRARTARLMDRLPDSEFFRFPYPDQAALACATSLRFRSPLALPGAPVTRVIGLPPLAAPHLFTSQLCTYAGEATVTFTAGAGHPRVRELPDLWAAAVTELHDAAVRGGQ